MLFRLLAVFVLMFSVSPVDADENLQAACAQLIERVKALGYETATQEVEREAAAQQEEVRAGYRERQMKEVALVLSSFEKHQGELVQWCMDNVDRLDLSCLQRVESEEQAKACRGYHEIDRAFEQFVLEPLTHEKRAGEKGGPF